MGPAQHPCFWNGNSSASGAFLPSLRRVARWILGFSLSHVITGIHGWAEGELEIIGAHRSRHDLRQSGC